MVTAKEVEEGLRVLTEDHDKINAEVLTQLVGIIQEQRQMIEKLATIQQEQSGIIKNLQSDIKALQQQVNIYETAKKVTGVY